MAVDAVVYYRIFDPIMSVCNVNDAFRSTQLLASTTLRNVLGTKAMSEVLSERESISHEMQVIPFIYIIHCPLFGSPSGSDILN